MTVTLHLVVPGDPQSKGRPRFDPRSGRAFTPQATRDAELLVALAAQHQGAHPISKGERVGVDLVFRCRTKRPRDLDNLVKLVCDALNGIAWDDDKQIHRIEATLERGCTEPSTVITVYTLEEE